MDERLKFVARLLDGEKMAVVCREFGISRKTGYKRLDEIPGIGPALATALVADPKAFRSGRDFSAGSASCRSRIRAGARKTWQASANKAIAICAACSRLTAANGYPGVSSNVRFLGYSRPDLLKLSFSESYPDLGTFLDGWRFMAFRWFMSERVNGGGRRTE
jgi:hypothetical protein